MVEVPADLRFTKTHQWVRIKGPIAVVGITDFAQEELHDVVYVELPEVGAQVGRGVQFAAVESVKARSEISSPVSGRVVRINSALVEGKDAARTELINDAPYGAGWLVEIEMSDPSEADELLSPDSYRKHIETKSH